MVNHWKSSPPTIIGIWFDVRGENLGNLSVRRTSIGMLEYQNDVESPGAWEHRDTGFTRRLDRFHSYDQRRVPRTRDRFCGTPVFPSAITRLLWLNWRAEPLSQIDFLASIAFWDKNCILSCLLTSWITGFREISHSKIEEVGIKVILKKKKNKNKRYYVWNTSNFIII